MIYGNGAVVGFTPQEVNDMTPWEYSAAITGWAKANGGGESAQPKFPTEQEFYDAMARLH